MDTIIELGKVTEETKGGGIKFYEGAPPDDCEVFLQNADAGCGKP